MPNSTPIPGRLQRTNNAQAARKLTSCDIVALLNRSKFVKMKLGVKGYGVAKYRLACVSTASNATQGYSKKKRRAVELAVVFVDLILIQRDERSNCAGSRLDAKNVLHGHSIRVDGFHRPQRIRPPASSNQITLESRIRLNQIV